MGSFDFDVWAYLSTHFGLVGGSSIAILLGGNIILFKRFMNSIKSEENYMCLLKDIEPLLTKIINGDKFTKAEIEDAKEIRNIIKSKIRKDVK